MQYVMIYIYYLFMNDKCRFSGDTTHPLVAI